MRRLLNTIKYTWWWGGWQPWANTLLYVPMKTDLTDHSNNHFTLTNTGVSLVSNQADIDVWYFNGSSYLSWANSSLFNFGDIHIWVWVKMAAIAHDQMIFAWVSNWNFFFGYGMGNYWGIGRNGIAWDGYYSYALNTGTWYYVTLDRSWNSLNISVNTSTVWTWTNNKTYTTSWWYQIGNDGTGTLINWYMSNLIIENKAWTAQEREDYYNQTKANYWIQSLNNSLTITPNIIIPDTPDNNWTWNVLSI